MREKCIQVLIGFFKGLTVIGILITGAFGYPVVQTAYDDWQLERVWESDPVYLTARAIEEACPFAYVVDIEQVEYRISDGTVLRSEVAIYIAAIPDVFAAMSEAEQETANVDLYTATLEAARDYLDPTAMQIWIVEALSVETFAGPTYVAECRYGLQSQMDTFLQWLNEGCSSDALTALLEVRAIQYYVAGFWARAVYHHSTLERPSYVIPPWCESCSNE